MIGQHFGLARLRGDHPTVRQPSIGQHPAVAAAGERDVPFALRGVAQLLQHRVADARIDRGELPALLAGVEQQVQISVEQHQVTGLVQPHTTHLAIQIVHEQLGPGDADRLIVPAHGCR